MSDPHPNWDRRQSIANSNPVRFIKLLKMMKYSIAGLLMCLTLNALVSYESADAALCMCHISSCVLFNGNNSILKNAEMYCPAIIMNINDILILRFNETTLSEDILGAYTNLSSLKLFEGSIQHIKPGVFEKLTNLTLLDIQKQNISTLEDYTFRGLDALEILDLNSNNLTSVAPYAFDGLKSLTRLILSGNKLTQLPAQLISSSPMLQSIYLNHNSLTKLPDGFFDNTDSLIRLDLANNRLQSFNFPDLKVMYLFLRNNSLTSINIGEHVTFVQANHNHIRSITGTGRNVTVLLLNDNAISDVTPIARMTNLAKLSLSNNPLLPDSVFASLTNLQELLLINTSIEISESTFANLSSMTLLDLSFNKLTQLDFRMFCSMYDLETLIVAFNHIQMINFIELREYLPMLHLLDICGNGWNATYMERMILQMTLHKLFFVRLCSTPSLNSSFEESEHTSEEISERVEQKFNEYYSTSLSSTDPMDSRTDVQIHTSTTIVAKSTSPKEDSVIESAMDDSLDDYKSQLWAEYDASDDQLKVLRPSSLYVVFLVLLYTLGAVFIVLLGYYVRQQHFSERPTTPIDSCDDAL